jgi:hypothetical protein
MVCFGSSVCDDNTAGADSHQASFPALLSDAGENTYHSALCRHSHDAAPSQSFTADNGFYHWAPPPPEDFAHDYE